MNVYRCLQHLTFFKYYKLVITEESFPDTICLNAIHPIHPSTSVSCQQSSSHIYHFLHMISQSFTIQMPASEHVTSGGGMVSLGVIWMNGVGEDE